MRIWAIFTVMSLITVSVATAETVQAVIDQTLAGLNVVVSEDPYSRTLKRMYIGWNEKHEPETGIVYREIESYKPITGVVIVDRTADGFILREALFPDIGKIRNPKERKEVLSILKQFKNVAFDPHAEKSAVDGLSGATRYGIKTSGYLNYMARRVALEMETPSDWAQPQNK